MMKKYKGAVYLFAVGMRGGETTVTFTVHGLVGEKNVEVRDESRKIFLKDGVFKDKFGPWDVHLYRITES
jgi:hypothetical protein